jgi:hypothetical protein
MNKAARDFGGCAIDKYPRNNITRGLRHVRKPPFGATREYRHWGRKYMTICIAAACRDKANERLLVLCSDWLVSSSLGSAEKMLKHYYLAADWWALSAGAEYDILATVQHLRSGFGGKTVDETNCAGIARAALNERKKEKINEFLQGRYALTYEEFYQTGIQKLPADIHREATMLLSQIEIEATFLIAGHIQGDIVIMETTENCRVLLRDDFACIGEGGYLAQASLLQRSLMETSSINRALYCVYEAKKAAEGVGSVGKRTSIALVKKGVGIKFIDVTNLHVLDAKVEKYGPQKFSTDDLKDITPILPYT